MSENIPDMPPAQVDPVDKGQQPMYRIPSDLDETSLLESLQDLRSFNRDQIRNVYESVFKEFFLDSFVGKTELRDHVRAWAGLVNGYNRWARVINDAGEELFLVPPIFNTETINPAAPADPNLPTLSNVIDMALFNTQHRRLARNEHVRDTTLAYLSTQINTTIDNEHTQAWRKIYAYYGIPFGEPKEPAGAEGKPEAAAPSVINDTDHY